MNDTIKEIRSADDLNRHENHFYQVDGVQHCSTPTGQWRLVIGVGFVKVDENGRVPRIYAGKRKFTVICPRWTDEGKARIGGAWNLLQGCTE